MTIFFILVFSVYCLSVLVLVLGWLHLSKLQQVDHLENHFISVIVPFRNEAVSIPLLLKSLRAQTYANEHFEVILVNDHSEDQSTEITTRETAQSNIKIIQLPSGKTGKKAALDYGISQAKGKIIVTTDADVHAPIHWLKKINEHFQSDKTKMLAGAVRIEPSATFFSKIQSLEFASLIGTSGAALAWNTPVMCNGANLAFLKSAYENVNGYEGNAHIPSGDDEFLMRKIATKWKDSVQFLFDPDAVVSTQAQPSLNNFINQRLRWAGKWKYNSSFLTKVIALTVLSFHLFFLLFFISALSGQIDLKLALLLWLAKIITEAIFLFSVCTFLRLRWHWISFFTLQFSYSFYVVLIGILSQVRGYSWKGRPSDL